jgi:hypothetical protein
MIGISNVLCVTFSVQYRDRVGLCVVSTLACVRLKRCRVGQARKTVSIAVAALTGGSAVPLKRAASLSK